jgi:hypothetical protein
MKKLGPLKSVWSICWLLISLAVLAFAVSLTARAGSHLVVDEPHRSDVILVLAGETEGRPRRALELMAQGYGRRVILDVPNHAKVFGFTLTDLAGKYVEDLPQPAAVSVCPIDGLSTRDESKDAEKCLLREGAESVLIVTSDFHTRRALGIFQQEVPQYKYSVAAARNEGQFGANWWTHRQWAKTFLDEWLRLIWWKLVDEWR